MNGLIAEPGCLWPFVARLNGWCAKSLPPTIARTPPVALSMTTADAVGPTPARCAWIAFAAAFCISGSSVVVM